MTGERGMSIDEMGAEIKAVERAWAPRIPQASGLMVRLDGKNFSSWTRPFDSPFDDRIATAFDATMAQLMTEYRPDIGYTQSDEITLIWLPPDDTKSEHIFGGKTQKIASVLAAHCSTAFNGYVIAPWAQAPALFDARSVRRRLRPAHPCLQVALQGRPTQRDQQRRVPPLLSPRVDGRADIEAPGDARRHRRRPRRVRHAPHEGQAADMEDRTNEPTRDGVADTGGAPPRRTADGQDPHVPLLRGSVRPNNPHTMNPEQALQAITTKARETPTEDAETLLIWLNGFLDAFQLLESTKEKPKQPKKKAT